MGRSCFQRGLPGSHGYLLAGQDRANLGRVPCGRRSTGTARQTAARFVRRLTQSSARSQRGAGLFLKETADPYIIPAVTAQPDRSAQTVLRYPLALTGKDAWERGGQGSVSLRLCASMSFTAGWVVLSHTSTMPIAGAYRANSEAEP